LDENVDVGVNLLDSACVNGVAKPVQSNSIVPIVLYQNSSVTVVRMS